MNPTIISLGILQAVIVRSYQWCVHSWSDIAFAAWPISLSLMGCHIMLNLSHPLWEREKDRGYIKGPHYIQDDFGARTCVLKDINSEVQKGFRFFFPFKLDSKRTKESFISSAVRISNLQVKYNVYSLIRTLQLCWWWQCYSSSPKPWSTRYLDNSWSACHETGYRYLWSSEVDS